MHDCQYQTRCFECNNNQIFSLLLMECVDSWEDDEIQVQSNFIYGLNICRNMDYFVNPLSESVLELGTRDHPYKTFDIVFRDLFNFLSGKELNVTINLLQSTTHHFLHHDVYLYGMSNITFLPYSLGNYDGFYQSDTTTRVSVDARQRGKFELYE